MVYFKLSAIHKCMSDKLKPREILVYPVKLSLFYVNRNLRETTKWCVFQEKSGISNDIIFPRPLVLLAISICIDIVCFIACE